VFVDEHGRKPPGGGDDLPPGFSYAPPPRSAAERWTAPCTEKVERSRVPHLSNLTNVVNLRAPAGRVFKHLFNLEIGR